MAIELTASKPISERADCNRPNIHAITSLQPEVLDRSVNTNCADVFSPVARIVMLTTRHAVRDQKTIKIIVSTIDFVVKVIFKESFLRANSFHRFKIRYPNMLSMIVKVDTARKMRYVFHGAMT